MGLIAQHTSLSAIEFSSVLNLPGQTAIRDWLGRLPELELIKSTGKTKGVKYFVNPEFLRKLDFKGKTNLKKIETHRLKELIYQDISIYPNSSIGKIHQRVGTEIPYRKIKVQLYEMVKTGELQATGKLKGRKYFIDKKA